jgi:hypothetical protein
MKLPEAWEYLVSHYLGGAGSADATADGAIAKISAWVESQGNGNADILRALYGAFARHSCEENCEGCPLDVQVSILGEQIEACQVICKAIKQANYIEYRKRMRRRFEERETRRKGRAEST